MGRAALKPQVYFFHGWGCDKSVWDPVLARIPPTVGTACWDRGYFGGASGVPLAAETGRLIVVTHSMGLMQVPAQVWERVDLLVAVNGFLSFVPEEREAGNAVRRSLRAMRAGGSADPAALVSAFRARAGLAPLGLDAVPVRSDLLLEDLARLGEWTVDPVLLQPVPTCFFFHDRGDPILHPSTIDETVASLPGAGHVFVEGTLHALPERMPDTIVRRILSVL